MLNLDIIKAARAEMGTHFHHQGRCPKVGLDCIGLILIAAKVVGISLPDLRGYSRSPNGQLEPKIREVCKQVEIAHDGDILLFWIRYPTRPQHVALKTDLGMIHTHSGVGKVVEHAIDDRWSQRLIGIFRLPGVY